MHNLREWSKRVLQVEGRRGKKGDTRAYKMTKVGVDGRKGGGLVCDMGKGGGCRGKGEKGRKKM